MLMNIILVQLLNDSQGRIASTFIIDLFKELYKDGSILQRCDFIDFNHPKFWMLI